MKIINVYLQEKLIINKDSKKSKFNPDFLNNKQEKLYSDNNEDYPDNWEDCQYELDTIDKKYEGFVVCKFNSLSKSKNLEKDVNDYSDTLENITERIITGKDMGYEIHLNNGHLEYHCLNSGSRAIYYIYALSNQGYLLIEQWFDGDDEVQNLDFLFDENNIIEITL